MKIVVIGSGFGGLSAAIRLRAQGHQVTLVEKLSDPGGRARVFRDNGFTFDAGPTIITAPSLLEDLFAVAGKSLADYVELVKLDPYYRIRFHDGTSFDYNGDRKSVIDQIRAIEPGDVAGYENFVEMAERIFTTGFGLIDKPFTHFTDMARVAPDLVRLGAHRSVAGLVNGYVRNPKIQQILSFHPLLVGGNPFQTTSIYALIHTLEQKWGVWFAMGGTGALVTSMMRLFEEIGGETRLGCEVGSIEIDDRTGRAIGVETKRGGCIPADAIVANSELARTYLNIVPRAVRKHNTDARIQKKRYSMSLFVLYFGTDIRYENIAHHEIHMGPRYRELLEDVFTRKILAPDFSLYLHRPTATDPSLAPDGCDSWYVLSPVPHLGGNVNWETAAEGYRDAIVRYLEERYLPGLSAHIVTERQIDPRYFDSTLNSYLGSAFSIEPTLTQSAWFRPHNRSEDVPNLYFAGAGTHPGAGIPGVLSSGKIVADMIGAA
ncbi:MAG TPA: phytoene desaturase [Gemmatimonadaceae bacterium]|nr:phytoene desaturase [Gemmatimonadaceae bacterium]